MKIRSLLIILPLLFLNACASKSAGSEELQEVIVENATVTETWSALHDRLKQDGVESEKLTQYFTMLPLEISQDPMGRKITELYNIKYKEKKPTTTPDKKPAKNPNYDYPPSGYKTPGPWYKGIVTKNNALLCIDFMNANMDAFLKAEKEYNVPKEVIAALLFVETRLGGYLGRENAFYTLASMAISTDYEQIPDFTKKLKYNPEEKEAWITETMEKRSEWAYNEFRALAIEIIENDLDPYNMPGSIYGAIGLCQFMPSNIKKLAVDGNEDGIINLFEPADAIASVGRYLKNSNWKTNSSTSTKTKVIRKYNNSTIYAQTILGLSERIEKNLALINKKK